MTIPDADPDEDKEQEPEGEDDGEEHVVSGLHAYDSPSSTQADQVEIRMHQLKAEICLEKIRIMHREIRDETTRESAASLERRFLRLFGELEALGAARPGVCSARGGSPLCPLAAEAAVRAISRSMHSEVMVEQAMQEAAAEATSARKKTTPTPTSKATRASSEGDDEGFE